MTSNLKPLVAGCCQYSTLQAIAKSMIDSPLGAGMLRGESKLRRSRGSSRFVVVMVASVWDFTSEDGSKVGWAEVSGV